MKKTKIIEKRMPPQHGVDRFYYPLREDPVSIEKTDIRNMYGRSEFPSKSDPNGSYTGIPTDGGVPVQDADDL